MTRTPILLLAPEDEPSNPLWYERLCFAWPELTVLTTDGETKLGWSRAPTEVSDLDLTKLAVAMRFATGGHCLPRVTVDGEGVPTVLKWLRPGSDGHPITVASTYLDDLGQCDTETLLLWADTPHVKDAARDGHDMDSAVLRAMREGHILRRSTPDCLVFGTDPVIRWLTMWSMEEVVQSYLTRGRKAFGATVPRPEMATYIEERIKRAKAWRSETESQRPVLAIVWDYDDEARAIADHWQGEDLDYVTRRWLDLFGIDPSDHNLALATDAMCDMIAGI